MASSSSLSSTSTPCAGCRFLRRKCMPDCPFAPYFPPDDPQKFINVHKSFGASNVAKLLNGIHPSNRPDAVYSLNFEAAFRLQDPIYGCVGQVYLLQQKQKQLQQGLYAAKEELSALIGPTAMIPFSRHDYPVSFVQSVETPAAAAVADLPTGFPPHSPQVPRLIISDHPRQHQQLLEAHQLISREQRIIRNYPQLQKTELGLFTGGYDGGAGPIHGSNQLAQQAAYESPSKQERDPDYGHDQEYPIGDGRGHGEYGDPAE